MTLSISNPPHGPSLIEQAPSPQQLSSWVRCLFSLADVKLIK
jgi:hypothetical protein